MAACLRGGENPGVRDLDAVVVGAGPNGLSAAVRIAQAGRSVVVFEARPTIGGGARTSELTLAEFRHDVCSTVHPLAIASPFLRSLPLDRFGLEWVHPSLALAHPLDGGETGVLARSVDETAERLEADGPAYRRLIGPLASDFAPLADGILRPVARVPRHPVMLRMALLGLRPVTRLARRTFQNRPARALLAGLAAHSIRPLDVALTSGPALFLGAAAHVGGWPFARGGSQRIVDALAGYLRELGGNIETSRPVDSLDALPTHRAVLFDTSPGALAEIAGSDLPVRFRRRLRRFRHGPGVFKIDYALDRPVPWSSPECGRAGTVHVGGSLEEIAASEAAVAGGRHPARPFVIVAQPSLFDDSRGPSGHHVLWAYCHVPAGSTVDMTEAVEAQLERFAPGFGDRVLARATRTAAGFETYNANNVGGDISGGAITLRQLVARPKIRAPYAMPADGMYLCSSSTPPGPGVHGMCGFWAAEAALRRELR
jgi:phytoene dehydrogenase-like protein